MILHCTCQHWDQDELHGKGLRVHNLALKGLNTAPGHRCTVCLKMHAATEAVKTPDVVKAK